MNVGCSLEANCIKLLQNKIKIKDTRNIQEENNALNKGGVSGESFIVSSAESLAHEHHELLLALVDLLEVVNKLGELDVAVVRHQEGVTRFA